MASASSPPPINSSSSSLSPATAAAVSSSSPLTSAYSIKRNFLAKRREQLRQQKLKRQSLPAGASFTNDNTGSYGDDSAAIQSELVPCDVSFGDEKERKLSVNGSQENSHNNSLSNSQNSNGTQLKQQQQCKINGKDYLSKSLSRASDGSRSETQLKQQLLSNSNSKDEVFTNLSRASAGNSSEAQLKQSQQNDSYSKDQAFNNASFASDESRGGNQPLSKFDSVKNLSIASTPNRNSCQLKQKRNSSGSSDKENFSGEVLANRLSFNKPRSNSQDKSMPAAKVVEPIGPLYPQQMEPGQVTVACTILYAQSTAEMYAVPLSYKSQLKLMHAQLQELVPKLNLFTNGQSYAKAIAAAPYSDDSNVSCNDSNSGNYMSDALVNCACIAYFPPERGYYRATVQQLICDKFAIVQFVDFGNSCCLPLSLLLECPDKFVQQMPPCAYRCQLADCCHRQYGPKAAARLRELLLGPNAEVLVTFCTGRLNCNASSDNDNYGSEGDSAAPHAYAVKVKSKSNDDLLDQLPIDWPEALEFFTIWHKRQMRDSMLMVSDLQEQEQEEQKWQYKQRKQSASQQLKYTTKQLYSICMNENGNDFPIDGDYFLGKECINKLDNQVRVSLPSSMTDTVTVLPLCSDDVPRTISILLLDLFSSCYAQLANRMHYLYHNLSTIVRQFEIIKVGQYCVIKLPNNSGQYARARVLSFGVSSVIVLLLDLGVEMQVSHQHVFKMLPEIANYAPQMHLKCQLLNRSAQFSDKHLKRLLTDNQGWPIEANLFSNAAGDVFALIEQFNE